MGKTKKANRQPPKVVYGEKVRLIQMGEQEQSCTKCGRLFGKDQMVVRYPNGPEGNYFCNWACSWAG